MMLHGSLSSSAPQTLIVYCTSAASELLGEIDPHTWYVHRQAHYMSMHTVALSRIYSYLLGLHRLHDLVEFPPSLLKWNHPYPTGVSGVVSS